jgi:hypothetical protein
VISWDSNGNDCRFIGDLLVMSWDLTNKNWDSSSKNRCLI